MLAQVRRESGGVLIEATIALPLLCAVLGSVVSFGMAYRDKVALVESGRMATRLVSNWAEVDADPNNGNLDDLVTATKDAVEYWLDQNNFQSADFLTDVQVFRLALASETPFVKISIKSAAPINLLSSYVALEPCIEAVGKARVRNIQFLPVANQLTNFCG